MMAPEGVVATAEAIIRGERARQGAIRIASQRARRIALSRAVARNAMITVAAIICYVTAIMAILTAYALYWVFSVK